MLLLIGRVQAELTELIEGCIDIADEGVAVYAVER